MARRVGARRRQRDDAKGEGEDGGGEDWVVEKGRVGAGGGCRFGRVCFSVLPIRSSLLLCFNFPRRRAERFVPAVKIYFNLSPLKKTFVPAGHAVCTSARSNRMRICASS